MNRPSFEPPELIRWRKDQVQFVHEQRDFLMEHFEEIRRDPRLFHARVGLAHALFLGDLGLTLGVLLSLWKSGKLLRPCPYCDADAFVIWFCGSPLSGEVTWQGSCPGCNKVVVDPPNAPVDRLRPPRPEPPFGESLITPVMEEVRRHPNTPLVEKGEYPRFSWSKGLVGERVPDRVLRTAVEPLPVEAVVSVLRGQLGRVALRSPSATPTHFFDWKFERLWTADGALLVERDGRLLRDADVGARFEWDGLYLRQPSGGACYELRCIERRGPAKVSGRVVLDVLSPPRLGLLLGRVLQVTMLDGTAVLEFGAGNVHRPNGEMCLTIDVPVPVWAWIIAALGMLVTPRAPS